MKKVPPRHPLRSYLVWSFFLCLPLQYYLKTKFHFFSKIFPPPCDFFQNRNKYYSESKNDRENSFVLYKNVIVVYRFNRQTCRVIKVEAV